MPMVNSSAWRRGERRSTLELLRMSTGMHFAYTQCCVYSGPKMELQFVRSIRSLCVRARATTLSLSLSVSSYACLFAVYKCASNDNTHNFSGIKWAKLPSTERCTVSVAVWSSSTAFDSTAARLWRASSLCVLVSTRNKLVSCKSIYWNIVLIVFCCCCCCSVRSGRSVFVFVCSPIRAVVYTHTHIVFTQFRKWFCALFFAQYICNRATYLWNSFRACQRLTLLLSYLLLRLFNVHPVQIAPDPFVSI